MIGSIDASAWKQTRHGARAGRGFHYQYLFSTLILVRQWAGVAPTGYIVPEGFEDCVIELPGRDVWVQIKSKLKGRFSRNYIDNIFVNLRQRARFLNDSRPKCLAVGLEQPCTDADVSQRDVKDLLGEEAEIVVVCPDPEGQIMCLLLDTLGISECVADLLLSNLYKLVADSAADNASLPFGKRRRLSTTEVERRISESLEATDPSAIDYALHAGFLSTVDFVTPIDDPIFYRGVKVQPGHIAAGLVLDCSDQIQAIVNALKMRRHLLVTGPSGAGKSALAWLAANALAGAMRWYQVSIQASAQDATAIVRFVRSRRPKPKAPIGLMFDDIGGINSNLWDILANELRGLPDVYLLGTIRNEDTFLITNRTDTEFFEAHLDEDLAKQFWEQLRDREQTTWTHWREPFEQSQGLMLEYVHLLTQGKQFALVIDEQVRQREREERYDELTLIRYTSVLCAYGGEVEAKKLCRLLEWELDRFSYALKRLLDEHIVRESQPGVLSGLHRLRSVALCDASHDGVSRLPTDSLWHVLLAATGETLPKIIQSMTTAVGNDDAMLQKLANLLAVSDDVEAWIAILTGLGLGTLEKQATVLIELLDRYEIPRAHHSLASFFADPSMDIPPLPGSTIHRNLQEAVYAFRALPQNDLRTACIERLPTETYCPPWTSLQQANRLLSCIVPIIGGKAVQIALSPAGDYQGQRDIHEIASLLSTAYLISPDMATQFVDALGGEQVLCNVFQNQMPWVTAPEIKSHGTHGRTIRADWFCIGGSYQTDPSVNLERICKILLALSPTSETAFSSALSPSKHPVTDKDGNTLPWSKHIITRASISFQTPWNVALCQMVLTKTRVDSFTEFIGLMTQYVQRTEQVFHVFTQHWIGKEKITDIQAVIDEMNAIGADVNELIYATSEGSIGKLDVLLTNILNLIQKMNRQLNGREAKSVATFAGSIALQVKEQRENSEIWRMTASPPLSSLSALEKRLNDICYILHEVAYDDESYTRFAAIAKEEDGLRVVARHCRSMAEDRFRSRLCSLEETLAVRNWVAKCWPRFINQGSRSDWPAAEIALLVEIADFGADRNYISDSFSAGQEQLADQWPFRVVPVVKGHVIVPFAALPSSQGPKLDEDFIEWEPIIDLPFLTCENSQSFDAAMVACNQISAIAHCRDLTNLHPEERETLAQAKASFQYHRKIVNAFAEKTRLGAFRYALRYIDSNWKQVTDEMDALKAGQVVEAPLYISFYREDAMSRELNAIHVRLLQAEAKVLTEKTQIP